MYELPLLQMQQIFMKFLPDVCLSLTYSPLNFGDDLDRHPDPRNFWMIASVTPITMPLQRRLCLWMSPLQLRKVILMQFFKCEQFCCISDPVALADICAF